MNGETVSNTIFEQDVVLMLVPLRWAQSVADHLGELRAGRPASLSQDDMTETAINVNKQGTWTEAMVDRLVPQITYKAAMALIDECAQHAGEWITKTDVETKLSITPYQLRNELGAFSKLTKKVFNMTTPIWPMEWRKTAGTYYYRMSPTIAAWWKAARQGS
jgi:hypothetical protein